MTLKDKLLAIIEQTKPHWYKVDAESCEQIADEFAIGFAIWIMKTDKEYDVKSTDTEGIIKELLEIYKKEKRL
jgi:hypothetical protein